MREWQVAITDCDYLVPVGSCFEFMNSYFDVIFGKMGSKEEYYIFAYYALSDMLQRTNTSLIGCPYSVLMSSNHMMVIQHPGSK